MFKRWTVLAVASVLMFAVACSDDDGGGDESGAGGLLGGEAGETADDAAGSDAGGSGGSGDAGGSVGASGAGYPADERDQFVAGCSSTPGNDEQRCGCMFDHLVENVPYEDYRAFQEAALEDPTTTPPDWVNDAAAACM